MGSAEARLVTEAAGAVCVSWLLALVAARHEGLAVLARALAFLGSVLVFAYFLFLPVFHGYRPELLLVALVLYPLAACQRGRAYFLRVWLLSTSAFIAALLVDDFLQWRYAWRQLWLGGGVLRAATIVIMPMEIACYLAVPITGVAAMGEAFGLGEARRITRP